MNPINQICNPNIQINIQLVLLDKKNQVGAWIILLFIIILQSQSISWEETAPRKFAYIEFMINRLALSTIAVSSEAR